jgi:biotin transporter BioY
LHLALVGKVRELKRKSLVGQIVVVLLGLQLLFFSGFISLSIPTATGKNLARFTNDTASRLATYLPVKYENIVLDQFPVLRDPPPAVRNSLYIPNTPVALFVGYILGSFLGPLAALLYVILGLVGPWFGVHPFAEGGGIEYYKHAGFGYLLGMIVAAWAVGVITAKKRTTFTQVLAVLAGVAAVHIVGLAFLLGSALLSSFLEGASAPAWQQWLFDEMRNLSWYALPYDLLFGIVAIALGFPFRWLVEILTAPDAVAKQKPQPALEELL